MIERLAIATVLLFGCALIPSQQTECSRNRPCGSGFTCDPATSTCQQAQGPADMGPDLSPAPFGDMADGPCAVHSDCTSNLCDVYQQNSRGEAGKCLPAASIIYVDNRGGGSCVSGDGSQAAPLCTLGEAASALSATRSNIRVLPSSASYKALSLDLQGRAVALYGPAGDRGTAQIGEASQVGLDISGNGTVLADGLAFTGGMIGVHCGGAAASLTLRRGLMTGNKMSGISTTGCQVTIDRCLVSQNGDLDAPAALSVMGGGYAISNSFIVKNQSSNQPAVELSGGGTFRFNTVADNHNGAFGEGGIECQSGSRIEGSIVFGNSTGNVSGSQLRTCVLDSTVVGTNDPVPDGVHKNPVFKDPGGLDYRLDAAADNSCCIDQVQSGTAFDYFGTKRPLGKAWDIGAHEAK